MVWYGLVMYGAVQYIAVQYDMRYDKDYNTQDQCHQPSAVGLQDQQDSELPTRGFGQLPNLTLHSLSLSQIGVKSKCCGPIIPCSYSFKEVTPPTPTS